MHSEESKSFRKFTTRAVAALLFIIGTNASIAQELNTTAVEQCDYSSANVNNGWGWNGKQQWLVEYPEYQAQRIELDNTAIIVYLDYDASENFNDRI